MLAAAAACAFVCGCHTTAGTTAVLNHENGTSLITEGNARLRNQLAVTGITYNKTPFGLNRVNIQVASLIQRTQYLQYRISWFDADGMEIDGDGKSYRDLVLQGGDARTLTGVAPTPAAVTSRLRIREQRAAY